MRILLLSLLLFFYVPAVSASPEVYMCPMHPHITGEEGDTCPICAMTLVPKMSPELSEHNGSGTIPENAFKIDPSYIHVLGVKTAKATENEFGKTIRAFGRVETSTRLERSVDVRVKGWVVDLGADAVGDVVKKGDLLFTFYSPELMEVQSDFVLGRRIGNQEQRLRLYGMNKKAIAELKSNGKFLEQTPFYAPMDGTVSKLSARKGEFVNEGGNILMLQDFSTLWINVDVALRDIEFLDVGNTAQVTFPETGKTIESVIDFIHPVSDMTSRTVSVRLVIENPEGMIKPNSYVEASFDANSRPRLSVPQEAVLYSGNGAHVMESLGEGAFRPIRVTTGITSSGLTEITSGLMQGQLIVRSGQFMIDAESNLRGGMAAMSHDNDQGEEMIMQPKQGENNTHTMGAGHVH